MQDCVDRQSDRVFVGFGFQKLADLRIREGSVAAGDEMIPVVQNASAISIANFLQLFLTKSFSDADRASLKELYALPSVPLDWKQYFRERSGV